MGRDRRCGANSWGNRSPWYGRREAALGSHWCLAEARVLIGGGIFRQTGYWFSVSASKVWMYLSKHIGHWWSLSSEPSALTTRSVRDAINLSSFSFIFLPELIPMQSSQHSRTGWGALSSQNKWRLLSIQANFLVVLHRRWKCPNALAFWMVEKPSNVVF